MHLARARSSAGTNGAEDPEGHLRGLVAGTSTIRQVVARAVPSLVIRAVVPAVLFLVGRSLWGLLGAVVLTLVWSLGVQLIRHLRGLAMSTILMIGIVELLVRSSAALALHSTDAYFVAPALTTALIGVAFVGSAFTAKPLAARVVWEVVPESVLHPDDPRTKDLLRKASVLYGTQHVAVAAVSLYMVFSMSTTAYVAVHPMLSWVSVGLMALVALPILRRHVSSPRQGWVVPGAKPALLG